MSHDKKLQYLKLGAFHNDDGDDDDDDDGHNDVNEDDDDDDNDGDDDDDETSTSDVPGLLSRKDLTESPISDPRIQ